jgi:Zn-finger nucleic acid-binding protein
MKKDIRPPQNAAQCPYCEQGHLWKAKINLKSIEFFICNECNMMWFDGEDLSKPAFFPMARYYSELKTLFGLNDAEIHSLERLDWVVSEPN